MKSQLFLSKNLYFLNMKFSFMCNILKRKEKKTNYDNV